MSGKGFNPGDRVTWTSQAGGIAKTKTGDVVVVVGPNEAPNVVLRAMGVRGKVDGPGGTRDHDSYIVRANGRLYWPRVSLLKAAGEE